MGFRRGTFERQICLSCRLIKVLCLRGENCLQKALFYEQNWALFLMPFKLDRVNVSTPDIPQKKDWRQIWRVAGRESGSPELPRKFPRLPRKLPELPRKFFGDVPGSSLTVELNSNPGVPRKFPRLPQKFPGSFPDFPGGQPFSLGSLTPSPDSQKLSQEKEVK